MPRRLPVVQPSDSEDAAAAARPSWQWIGIGAGLVFTIWLPLLAVALPVGVRLAEVVFDEAEDVMTPVSAAERAALVALTIGPPLLAFALAGLFGGLLVGRFAGRTATREAALGGFGAASVAWLIAEISGALSPWPVAVTALVVLGALGAGFGALGGHLGKRLRRPRQGS